jgi:hypothetical protein
LFFLTLQQHSGLNSNYCPWCRDFKFIVPPNVFMNVWCTKASTEGLIWHSLSLQELYWVHSKSHNSFDIAFFKSHYKIMSSFQTNSIIIIIIIINTFKIVIHQNNIEIQFLPTHNKPSVHYAGQKINSTQGNNQCLSES